MTQHKQVRLSGYLGNVNYIAAEGKAYSVDGMKEIERTQIVVPLLSLDKYLMHTELKQIRFEGAFISDGKEEKKENGQVYFVDKIKSLPKDELEFIASKFKKEKPIPKSKDEQIKELQEALLKSNELLEKLSKENDVDQELEDLKAEYEDLAGKKPDARMKKETLINKIQELKDNQ